MEQNSSVKYTSVDQYISSFPQEIQVMLEEIRSIIKDVIPDAGEVISYNMPAFRKNTVLVYYAGYKKHIGFYPTPGPVTAFKDELTSYKISKSAVQFPIGMPFPVELIQKMVKYRVEEDQLKTKNKYKK